MPPPPAKAAAPALAAALAAAALAATSLASAAGCGGDRRPPADRLVLLIDAPVGTLDPRYTVTSNDTKFSRLVATGLVATDTEDQAPRLELAAAITQRDPLTWDVALRPDARFSDGAPVTAADVVFTFDSMTRPGADSVYAGGYRERFARVEATGERAVRFTLKEPLATFVTDLEIGIVARHAAQADGRFAGGVPVGAGPYRAVAVGTRGLRLVANPHYHGAAPALGTVEVRVVKDQAARATMLVGGSADLAQNVIRADLVDDVAGSGELEVSSSPSSILSYLMFNNADPVLRDVRVRQAIALAVDREAIVQARFAGRATLATGLLPPGHWAYEPAVARWTRDLPRARRLLDEAGYPAPASGGPRLALVYKTSADQFRIAVARLLAAQLGDVGIAVEVRAFEFNTFLADLKKGQFQLASMQTSDIGEPDYFRTYFHSGRIPSADNRWIGNNRWRYRSARVDELTERGRRELDPARRRALYAEVQRIVADELPIVPLWHEDNVVVHHRSVTGYRIVPSARFGGLVSTRK